MPNFQQRCLFEQAQLSCAGSASANFTRDPSSHRSKRTSAPRARVRVRCQHFAERGRTVSVILRKMPSGGALFEAKLPIDNLPRALIGRADSISEIRAQSTTSKHARLSAAFALHHICTRRRVRDHPKGTGDRSSRALDQ